MERTTYGNAKRLKQVKKHLFDNRKNLTEEGFADVLDDLAQELFSLGYIKGWDRRNELYRITSTQRRMRMRSDFNEFYNEQVAAQGNTSGTKPLMIKQIENVENIFRDWM
jgi:hypothetical protein